MGPYLGLVPKQEDSGETQPQLGISKAGDTMVRKLLVGSAHYILGPFGPDTDLRRYGLRLCERGGKNAKKRAAVAVARKLAVLLHRLWVSGEVYEPLHNAMSAPIAVAASRPGGRGKKPSSEGTIATRFVVEGRTEVDEARTRFDPGGLADDDIHRLVRVTAYHVLVHKDRSFRWQPQQSQVHYGSDGPGYLRSNPNLHRALKRPIQSADRSMATVGWRRPEFPGGLGSKQIQNVLRPKQQP